MESFMKIKNIATKVKIFIWRLARKISLVEIFKLLGIFLWNVLFSKGCWQSFLMVGLNARGMDATHFKEMNLTGIGMILRNSNGRVICFPGCWQVQEDEAMGLYEALSWRLDTVEFETDSKIIYTIDDSSELGFIAAN